MELNVAKFDPTVLLSRSRLHFVAALNIDLGLIYVYFRQNGRISLHSHDRAEVLRDADEVEEEVEHDEHVGGEVANRYVA